MCTSRVASEPQQWQHQTTNKNKQQPNTTTINQTNTDNNNQTTNNTTNTANTTNNNTDDNNNHDNNNTCTHHNGNLYSMPQPRHDAKPKESKYAENVLSFMPLTQSFSNGAGGAGWSRALFRVKAEARLNPKGGETRGGENRESRCGQACVTRLLLQTPAWVHIVRITNHCELAPRLETQHTPPLRNMKNPSKCGQTYMY